MRYFLELTYKGTAYNGWQIQKNARSVQGEIQNALTKLLRSDTSVTGAGRTDTGVHATYYVAHFDTVCEIKDSEVFLYHLNSILPQDIAARGLRKVRDDAHARFDAIEREYTYVILPYKDPFRRETSWQYYRNLNVESMNEAAAYLLMYNDFTSFAKLNSGNKTNICNINFAAWNIVENGEIRFTIKADRFLRNMVRAIVGTLVEVGCENRDVYNFKHLIESRNLSLCGSSAPPHGLFLSNVQYSAGLFF